MLFISNRYVFLYYFKLCPQIVLYPVYFIHSESLLAYLKPTNIYIWYKFYTYKQMEQGNRYIILVKLSKPIDIYFCIQCTKYSAIWAKKHSRICSHTNYMYYMFTHFKILFNSMIGHHHLKSVSRCFCRIFP